MNKAFTAFFSFFLNTLRMPRRVLFALFLFTAGSAMLSALGSSERYDVLIKDGSVSEIRAEFRRNGELVTYTVGENGDTLLMRALQYDRDEEIIKLLINAGVGARKKNRLGRTALSYACEFTTSADIFTMVAKAGGRSNKSIQRRLMQTDKNGKHAAAYAELNEAQSVREAVASYLEEADILALDSETEGGVPRLLSAYIEVTGIVPATAANTETGVESETSATEHIAPTEINNNEADANTQAEITNTENDADAQAEIATTTEINNAGISNIDDTALSAAETANTEQALASEPIAIPLPPSSSERTQSTEERFPDRAQLYDYAVYAIPTPNVEDDDTPSYEVTDESDKNGVTRLMSAIKAGNDWAIAQLLSNGADVNARDNEGWTPLMYAVRYQNSSQLVQTLVEHGAEIKTENAYGVSSLTIAAQYSENPEMLSLLLATYSAGDDAVTQALVYTLTGNIAHEQIQYEKVRLFVEKGVPLNRFWNDRTPLMYAASSCSSTAIIDLLLKNGALASIRTSDGRTAFDFAQENRLLARDNVYWSLNSSR